MTDYCSSCLWETRINHKQSTGEYLHRVLCALKVTFQHRRWAVLWVNEGRGQLGSAKRKDAEQRRRRICNGDRGKRRGRQLLLCWPHIIISPHVSLAFTLEPRADRGDKELMSGFSFVWRRKKQKICSKCCPEKWCYLRESSIWGKLIDQCCLSPLGHRCHPAAVWNNTSSATNSWPLTPPPVPHTLTNIHLQTQSLNGHFKVGGQDPYFHKCVWVCVWQRDHSGSL